MIETLADLEQHLTRLSGLTGQRASLTITMHGAHRTARVILAKESAGAPNGRKRDDLGDMLAASTHVSLAEAVDTALKLAFYYVSRADSGTYAVRRTA